MKVKELVESFGKHAQIKEFLDNNQESGRHIARFEGLAGSAAAMSVAAIFAQRQCDILVLLPESDEAEFFKSDLTNLLSDNDVLLLPESFKRPFELDEINNDAIQVRAELISKLQKSESPHIVVATPESIMEKVISDDKLRKNSFQIRLSEKLDLEFLSDFLDENEFEREDFVYEPGQYAVRGGIVDIYSFSNDKPYRIEMDGDTIESIRTFEIDSQLSVARINHLSIVPNIQSSGIAGEKVALFKYF
ncbi:MAG: transcription-repair coupling factor, partial [Bacteroidia bacterium]|nr:transcription-repair coupling factor [Bacteroidia bacterium]